MKYHLIHHRLTGVLGHRFAEAQGLVEELERRGAHVQVYMGEGADADVLHAFPTGRAVLRDPVFSSRSFDERSNDFAKMLHDHLDSEVSKDDRVLITVATQCESLGLARWLHKLPADRKPWIVIYMMLDRWNHGTIEERDRQYGEWALYKAEMLQLSAGDRERLVFLASTDRLADDISRLSGAEVRAAATPLPSKFAHQREYDLPRLDRAPVVAILGGARPEKGSGLVPEIVRLASLRTDADFIVQVSNELLPEAEYRAFREVESLPRVQVFSHPNEYHRMFDAADVLLLPYRTTPYARRTSGVFFEAVLSGKPVIVPEATWMGEQVTSGNAAGVVFREHTPERVADAVVICLRDHRLLCERAQQLSETWRRKEGVIPFVNRLEQELSARRPSFGAR